jgi:hypothetical protein
MGWKCTRWSRECSVENSDYKWRTSGGKNPRSEEGENFYLIRSKGKIQPRNKSTVLSEWKELLVAVSIFNMSKWSPSYYQEGAKLLR